MTGIIQGLLASLAGSAATVPDAPTIGTATATGSTTATVTYTAPVSNGGAAITSYTAIDQNGTVRGSISQAGSGTINLTGLTSNTSYTFRVYATNSVGNSPNSSASNQITTSVQIVPVDVLMVGGGGAGGSCFNNGAATGGVLRNGENKVQGLGGRWFGGTERFQGEVGAGDSGDAALSAGC